MASVTACPEHWRELADELKAHGLGKFFANSLNEAIACGNGDNYEPLMRSMRALLIRAMEILKEDGVNLEDIGCPLCHLIEHCPCHSEACGYRKWIGIIANEEYQHAVGLGLVG